MIAVSILISENRSLSGELSIANKYVQNYFKTHKLPVATNENQEYFYQLITESGLNINNKNYAYSPSEQQEELIVASYNLSLQGTYLNFLRYLNSLNSRIMLYKIDSINLKVDSFSAIKIQIELKTLYEAN